jgi:hypothetical protein
VQVQSGHGIIAGVDARDFAALSPQIQAEVLHLADNHTFHFQQGDQRNDQAVRIADMINTYMAMMLGGP